MVLTTLLQKTYILEGKIIYVLITFDLYIYIYIPVKSCYRKTFSLLLFSNIDPDEPKKKGKRQKGGTSGFLAPIPISDALVKFLGTGESALSRADVVKRIWEYIKQNNLQVYDGYYLVKPLCV